MSGNPKTTTSSRSDDLAGLLVIMVGLVLLGIAMLLFANYNSTNSPDASPINASITMPSSAGTSNRTDTIIVGGHASSVGSGSTDSSSTSHTENGDGS